eukprot:scaffold8642_cov105-Cylindrotheca_fusiformis.AAC.5
MAMNATQPSGISPMKVGLMRCEGIFGHLCHSIHLAVIGQCYKTVKSAIAPLFQESFQSRSNLNGRFKKQRICYLWSSKRPKMQLFNGDFRMVDDNVSNQERRKATPETVP